MRVKTRIWALPAVAAGIFLIVGVVIGVLSSQAQGEIAGLADVDYPFLDQVTRLAGKLEQVEFRLDTAIALTDPQYLTQAEKMGKEWREGLAGVSVPKGQESDASALAGAFDAYFKLAIPTTRIMLGLDQGNVSTSIGALQKARKDMDATMSSVQENTRKAFVNSANSARVRVRNTVIATAIGALVVVIALASGSYLLISDVWRRFGGEPEYACAELQTIAEADFSREIMVDPRAHGSVLAAVRDVSQRLGHLITDVHDSTDTIATASREIAAGNQDLSNRTERQAASLQQAAASMEQLSTNLALSTENARQASQLATSANDAAMAGGEVVARVIDTMSTITASSKRMAEIINVIDGIAFQTNILALNAAVEAARAGEQGRGFAVVAGEVRELAQRSALASREIRTIIDESVDKIGTGSALVSDAGESMKSIVAQVKHVQELIKQIAEAAQEQSAGIGSVSQAVTQMDQATQQNAAMVEQSAAAATSLMTEAARLAEAVSVFKVAQAA